MRALALHLPTLGLDLWRREEPAARPRALVEARGARLWVVSCSPEALAAGALPGVALDEARGRAGELEARPRDPALEREALEGLAAWAYAELSPRVALEEDALLIDLAGTERLHKDEAAVVRRLLALASRRGLTARAALADPPAAALALARHAPAQLARGLDAAALQAALGALPPTALGLDPTTERRLRALGLERLEQVWALPRGTLPPRLGDALLLRLDELLGARERELRWFLPEPPPTVRSRWDDLPLSRLDQLQEASARLAVELAGELERLGLLAGELVLELELERRPRAGEEGEQPAPARLHLSAPSADGAQLARLLRAHLAARPPRGVTRVYPVVGLSLAAGDLRRVRATQRGLFAAREEARRKAEAELAELVNRLELTLGPERVTRLAATGDPRPERASAAVAARARRAAASTEAAATLPPRPLRLLARPRPLRVAVDPDGAPREVREGLVSWTPAQARGPERLEVGWWEEGGPARRDYWVVRDPAGRALWLYRDLGPEGGREHGHGHERDGGARAWFLHGVFD